MKRIRIVGLCLMAVFAVSAVAASGASAGTLLLKATNGNIAGGEFLSKGGVSKLVTTTGKEITCSSVINHGKLHNSTLGLVLILFKGCKETEFGTSCGNPASSGEIHIPLSTIFHVGLAHNTPGTNTTIPAIIILLPAGGVNFSCVGGLVAVKVTGNVIGELRSGGVQAELAPKKYGSLELVFQQTAGVQALKLILLEGETLTNQHLTSEIGGAVEEAGQESTDTLDGFTNGNGEATEVELVEP